jgi:hypothetical protein
MNNLLSKIKKGPTKLPPKIMLIGVEGVGKSTAGASMPNPVFICGESGLVGPQFEGIPNFTPESWKDILDFCEELALAPGDFRTLVIDTLDWVEPMLYAHVCAEGKQKNIESFGYGKGYVLAQQEARKLLVALDKVNRAGLNILLLSHSQLRKVQNVLGDDYDHFESKLNAKVGGIFKEWADAVLFARFETFVEKVDNKVKAYGGSTRVVETTHSAAWDAKNRYGLPEQMPLDMLAILSAMDGNGGDAKTAEIELRGLLERLPKDKADKTLKWLETPRSVVDLQKVLNNVKNAIKEADNG